MFYSHKVAVYACYAINLQMWTSVKVEAKRDVGLEVVTTASAPMSAFVIKGLS